MLVKAVFVCGHPCMHAYLLAEDFSLERREHAPFFSQVWSQKRELLGKVRGWLCCKNNCTELRCIDAHPEGNHDIAGMPTSRTLSFMTEGVWYPPHAVQVD